MKKNVMNAFGTLDTLQFEGGQFHWHSLPNLQKRTGRSMRALPRSLRILLENLLRHADADSVKDTDIEAMLDWQPNRTSQHEIQFTPSRVLLQDFTGVPVIVDLAAMRTALAKRGGRPELVNPIGRVDLVVDHSVQVDAWANANAYSFNSRLDFKRNLERYEFLKWGQAAFKNFRVVPPATGICHQVNLEFLAEVARRSAPGSPHGEWVFPDTLVGTDSHTPMIGGLGVLGWGVGGIEAEAAMLGQPCSMLIPDVVGFELRGELGANVTATDLVLTITQILRKKGVVGKFVEFTGPGVLNLSIADRATVSNMAPEYGATVGLWPVDRKTTNYLELTGRKECAKLTEAYYKAQDLWFEADTPSSEYSDGVTLNLGSIEPSVAGPTKPHDRSPLAQVKKSFATFMREQMPRANATEDAAVDAKVHTHRLTDGHVVIAAITSCTNTSNPTLMIGAGLLARNALARGLKPAPWVKTSFAPGSKAVMGYLKECGLSEALDQCGFNLVGYGCTTCIGNSGPLPDEIADAIENRKLVVAAVLSGNRNFEARIHPQVRANYLCSPPLVVAFALAGRIDIDFECEPLGVDGRGGSVFLRDIWPDSAEIERLSRTHVVERQFSSSYNDVFGGDENWRGLTARGGADYEWSESSTYIRRPPFLDDEFANLSGIFPPIENAKILAHLGDFITTDHISPAGSIGADTPAGRYLRALGIEKRDFNSYGARRGNHEVMMRGTFANIRLRNRLVAREGGWTRHWPDGKEVTIFDAAERYKARGIPLVVVAGREYGTGSSRDWAAKGTRLLGVRAVIARSFERIHRSNLIGMGVLPIEIADDLSLKGDESVSIEGLAQLLPKSSLGVRIVGGSGVTVVGARSRIDTANELRYLQAGGILPYVLKRLQDG